MKIKKKNVTYQRLGFFYQQFVQRRFSNFTEEQHTSSLLGFCSFSRGFEAGQQSPYRAPPERKQAHQSQAEAPFSSPSICRGLILESVLAVLHMADILGHTKQQMQ